MRGYGRRFLALGAFFVLATALSGCGSNVPGNSVASVVGNPITTAAFNHWMFVAAKSQAAQNPSAPVIVPNDPPGFTKCIAQARKEIPTLAKTPASQLKTDCKQLFTSLSGQVMTFLIKAYWYQLEARKEGIVVTDAQVQAAFDKARKQQFQAPAQFQQFLTQTGQTTQDILFRFRINQIFMKLLAKYTTKVTPAQIAAYYQSHLSQFGTPETRDIRIVLAKTQSKANAARSALQSGQSWKSVAKQFSIDPTSKDNGGLLVGVTKGQEDQALDKAAFSAPLNRLEGPVKGQFGFYIFQVTKVTKAKQQSLTQATPLIQQTLTGQQQTSSQATVDSLTQKHWQKQTFCRSLFMVPQCSGYKAPKTTPTTTPTPTPPPPSSTPPPTPTTK
jgi:parvulin-like peptidyl-prolyl isomerase